MTPFKRVLVANRGEIAIRVFRACHELGIRTVAIYSKEDKNSLFRTKADESYLIGATKGPIEAYLNIDEIVKIARNKGVDAIHPGYGFLAENPEFARKCEEAGIAFIGPDANMMIQMGDKIKSKVVAASVGVPTIPGFEKPLVSPEQAYEAAQSCGYPIILKAAAGGGGRGMRIVKDPEKLIDEYKSAKNEAGKAFGIDDVFIEKYIENPKHIEVQILGDSHGNILHLYERDCSIQRRHQKLIEFSPSLALSEKQRQAICQDAVKIAKAVNYKNAGTVEFLVDKEGNHYFIEMNPRIQVEHTVTERVTGVDIVQAQILIAQGELLSDSRIGLPCQEAVQVHGYAIQSRITTEDPANQFAPDTGMIDLYRSASGFGIRLDGGNGYTGALITPYYDSLLVKCTSWSRTFEDAIRKSTRAIKEMRIHGVKTNIPFLINVLNHETFQKGDCDTNFIESHESLFDFTVKKDADLRLLKFIGDKAVNVTGGNKKNFDVPLVPIVESGKYPRGTKQILESEGAHGVVQWIKSQDKLLLTDTTMRDAHQSLMATRMRTQDLKKIAEPTAHLAHDLFSVEMWGGATFDVAYRFLNESPWDRLDILRKKMPNILLQMLIRGANGVGYKNYPDNVISALINESAKRGIDVFRIFDALNWLEGMERSIDFVLSTGKIAEACICYTGDILDTSRDKYSLGYYVDLAKSIEKTGAHILGIKDMSALLKPYAAFKLVKTLKEHISIPIHLHTHDTTGNGVATLLMAAEAGVDIVDTAFNAMSGLTSQPALNSVVAALKNTDRDTGICLEGIQKLSDYWASVRPVYEGFESDLKSTSAEIYKFEIPGGQYSNLKPQVESFGLGHRFGEVKEMYKSVNTLFGDIVKVTPSSKAVGDMAIFMVQNDLTPENIMEKGKGLSYPDSVEAYFEGMMGQPPYGFPEKLQKLVLKDKKPLTVRPGSCLEPEDFQKISQHIRDKYKIEPSESQIISAALYPKVFDDYLSHRAKWGDFSRMGSDVYFHGLSEGETCEVELDEGKTVIVKLLEIGKADDKGRRRLAFEVNGNRRDVKIEDKALLQVQKSSMIEEHMAQPGNPMDIGASIPGTVIQVLVKEGETVKKDQAVAVVEAMKMETNVLAQATGTVEKIYTSANQMVKAGQLLIRLLPDKV